MPCRVALGEARTPSRAEAIIQYPLHSLHMADIKQHLSDEEEDPSTMEETPVNNVPSTKYHGVPKSMSNAEDVTEVTMVALPEWPEGLTPPQERFLNAYSLGGSITQACRSCSIARANPYRWRDGSDIFSEALTIAKEYGVQRLEDWALARAMDAMNPSDRLTEFLLKAARPEVYRERVDHHLHGKVEHRKRVILEALDQDRIVEAVSTHTGENTEEHDGSPADL